MGDGAGTKLGHAIILGNYVAAAPVVANGQYANPRVDSDAILLVRTVGAFTTPITRYDSQGDAAGVVVKAVAGELLQVTAYNASASTRYLQIHDVAAVPANGTVPDWTPIPVLAGETIAHYFGEAGLPMSVGIVLVTSSTRVTLTIAAAEMWFSARYR
jgi:hypothetical protein